MCLIFVCSKEVITMYYIYKIENLKNKKKYIGLTNNIARRQSRHLTDLKFGRHDNQFLQKEYNLFGRDAFHFSVIYEQDVNEKEIGRMEKIFVKQFDSYHNGYNQNEGGNFGASNGGSQLIQSDIFNILSALEFMSRPGQILANIYDVSRTTISRIKKGENHIQYKRMYDALSEKDRKEIYKNFCDSTNFCLDKINTTIIQSKRQLTEEQVHWILYNFEHKIFTWVRMAQIVGVKSTYTLDCIRYGKTYKDFSHTYKQLTKDQKAQLASLLSNQQ